TILFYSYVANLIKYIIHRNCLFIYVNPTVAKVCDKINRIKTRYDSSVQCLHSLSSRVCGGISKNTSSHCKAKSLMTVINICQRLFYYNTLQCVCVCVCVSVCVCVCVSVGVCVCVCVCVSRCLLLLT